MNKRIGLVVVGDGPASELFKQKAKLLNISRSVVFVKVVEDLVSYLKTCDLFIETDTSESSEIRVLQAAAAGAPILTYRTDLRADLFKDEISAMLCEDNDIPCLSQKFAKFLNTQALWVQLRNNSRAVAEERLHEDKDSYYEAIRDTIEAVLRGAVSKNTDKHEVTK